MSDQGENYLDPTAPGSLTLPLSKHPYSIHYYLNLLLFFSLAFSLYLSLIFSFIISFFSIYILFFSFSIVLHFLIPCFFIYIFLYFSIYLPPVFFHYFFCFPVYILFSHFLFFSISNNIHRSDSGNRTPSHHPVGGWLSNYKQLKWNTQDSFFISTVYPGYNQQPFNLGVEGGGGRGRGGRGRVGEDGPVGAVPTPNLPSSPPPPKLPQSSMLTWASNSHCKQFSRRQCPASKNHLNRT